MVPLMGNGGDIHTDTLLESVELLIVLKVGDGVRTEAAKLHFTISPQCRDWHLAIANSMGDAHSELAHIHLNDLRAILIR